MGLAAKFKKLIIREKTYDSGKALLEQLPVDPLVCVVSPESYYYKDIVPCLKVINTLCCASKVLYKLMHDERVIALKTKIEALINIQKTPESNGFLPIINAISESDYAAVDDALAHGADPGYELDGDWQKHPLYYTLITVEDPQLTEIMTRIVHAYPKKKLIPFYMLLLKNDTPFSNPQWHNTALRVIGNRLTKKEKIKLRLLSFVN